MFKTQNQRCSKPKIPSADFPFNHYLEQLDEVIALVNCQYNSLSDIISQYGCGDHHLYLNNVIRNKLKNIYNTIDTFSYNSKN